MIRLCIIGISGYTGIEALRIAINHPKIQIVSLVADKNADQFIDSIYPAFSGYSLPKITKLDCVDFNKIDCVISCLPHGTSQEIIMNLYQKYKQLKIIDLSADFRFNNIILLFALILF
jgi:N-acetyl-gamma-glutamyl-phosphate reductase